MQSEETMTAARLYTHTHIYIQRFPRGNAGGGTCGKAKWLRGYTSQKRLRTTDLNKKSAIPLHIKYSKRGGYSKQHDDNSQHDQMWLSKQIHPESRLHHT
ncbi:hypothetical protein ILYODFUR_030309 [Ilyodon furcidens]|uniref:Uncharacterized protein n=1 Tax=Ilyodon furcidens TaxID=33524 RepID=A0ABV0SQF2_9TELE